MASGCEDTCWWTYRWIAEAIDMWAHDSDVSRLVLELVLRVTVPVVPGADLAASVGPHLFFQNNFVWEKERESVGVVQSEYSEFQINIIGAFAIFILSVLNI